MDVNPINTAPNVRHCSVIYFLVLAQIAKACLGVGKSYSIVAESANSGTLLTPYSSRGTGGAKATRQYPAQ